jgi:hypothetical protein
MGLYHRQQFAAFIRRLVIYLPSNVVLNDRESFAAFAANAWDYISARIALYWLSGWIIASALLIANGGAFSIFVGFFSFFTAVYAWIRSDVIRVSKASVKDIENDRI